MQQSAQQPMTYGHLDEHKRAWLKSLALADDRSVIDCDPTAGLITFQTDEGPITRQAVECFSRVMGYFRPASAWNIGKQGEFADRVYFEERVAERPPA